MAKAVNIDVNVPKRLERRVRMWLRRACLTDWQVTVLLKENLRWEGEPCRAYTDWIQGGYQTAEIAFDLQTYTDSDERTFDLLILHELDHLRKAREDDVLRKMIGNNSVVYTAYSEAAEGSADTFALAMYRAYAGKKGT